MPWNIKWYDDEERVFMITPTDPWAWGEMEATFEQGRAMIASKPYIVDLIVYFSSDVRPPHSASGEHVAPWVILRDQVLNSPSNRGIVVVVAAPLYVESVVRNLKAVMKDQLPTDYIRFAETLDEAEALIGQARAAREET
jgi:hypothetical protein